MVNSKIVIAKKLMHGKTSLIKHNGKGIFKGIKKIIKATRYHSLIIDKKKNWQRSNCYCRN